MKAFRLPAEQAAWIETEARRLGESETTIIRMLLRTAMAGSFALTATLTATEAIPVAN